MPYETRIVVRRPTNPQRFGGVVVVDWQNVTAGHDIDTEWGGPGGFFVRHGWTWVGASVQRVGVNGATTGATANLGLRQWSPSRYGALDLTNGGTVLDDSQSYDVYTQIARLAKQGPSSGPNPFAGLDVRDVYAGGVSQSATFLIRYYNAIQAAAERLRRLCGRPGRRRSARRRRHEADEGVHGDRRLGVAGGAARSGLRDDPDVGDRRRLARACVSGLARRDGLPRDARRHPDARVRAVASGRLPQPGAERRRGVGGLRRRVRRARSLGGRGRPAGERANPIEVSSLGPPVTLVRDANGIALGGIRLPKVAVPVALNNGVNGPASLTNPLSVFCVLYGTHAPFDETEARLALSDTRRLRLEGDEGRERPRHPAIAVEGGRPDAAHRRVPLGLRQVDGAAAGLFAPRLPRS